MLMIGQGEAVAAMGQPKILISIGGAWVDPREVVAVEAATAGDKGSWWEVRVTLKNGHVVLGQRAPADVAMAVRHPEQDEDPPEPGGPAPRPRRIGARRHPALSSDDA
jgi:hypothetical protein